MRNNPAPWGGRQFDDLQPTEREELKRTKIDAFLMGNVENSDEVRDLFIRLQSGTALSRQQIRDAWPGNIGPFAESLAGKLGRFPSASIFTQVDGRSRRNDEDKDVYSADRQFCAQLLCLFLAREADPDREQSTGAEELDALYHDNTNFDAQGPAAARFREMLVTAADVLDLAIIESARSRSKFKKLDITALCCLLQDLARRPHFTIDNPCKRALAERALSPPEGARRTGKGTSGPTIHAYCSSWREGLPQALGIRLDSRRAFNESQKEEIRGRDKVCQICQRDVALEDQEFDHYPQPYYLGGPTEVSNGRLVCRACHPRGKTEGTGQTVNNEAS